MKISKKIILTFLVVFVSVILLTGYFIGTQTTNLIRKQAREQIENINNVRAEHIKTYLNSEKEVVEILAASTVFRDFLKTNINADNYLTEKERTSQRLIRSIKSVVQMYELFILDKNGKIIVSTDKTKEGIDKSEDAYFTEAKNNASIKDIYFSDTVNKITYTVSAPIKDDATSELLGVIVARMDPANLLNITGSKIALGKTGESFLVNSNKYLITPSRFLGDKVILNKKIETQNINDCFSSEEVGGATNAISEGDVQYVGHESLGNYIDYRGVEIIGTHAYIPQAKWCLVTKIDRAETLIPSLNLLKAFIIINLLGLLLFLIIGLALSRGLTRSIETLVRSMKKVEGGDLDVKISTKSKDEIGYLSHSFQKMIESVKDSRKNIDIKVEEQTKELKKQESVLEKQQKAILNVLQDTEGQKKSLDVLAKDLEKFKLAVENASDHIVITDKEGLVIYANKMVETITGFGVKEVLGKKAGCKDLWGGLMTLPFYQEMWKTIKDDKKIFSGEINNRRKNGEDYIAKASIAPILNNDGEVIFFVGIEHDITKEKEIDKAKTEFVSLAAHQLKTPIGALNWDMEMLMSGDYGKLTEQQNEVLDEMHGLSVRMNELINNFLNVSRIELGVFIIEPVPTDFAKLCEEVLLEMEPRCAQKNQIIIKDFDEKLPQVPADPSLLRIIFQNFISNAIKYTQDKGNISISLKTNGKEIIFSVIDNGDPIPIEDQSKIFEKMFRASNAQKLDPDGNGLGLYLVKKIVENAKGRVWFTSKKGEDTIFSVAFLLSGMVKKEGTKKLT
jgi:PAS domain S-box-containing protein